MFFLKCMENDDARLPQLIEQEIKAREWFILCESEHSRNSSWVQQEVDLIKGMEGKVFETIDLSKDIQAEFHKLVRLSKRATVFISYSRQDREIADRIERALEAHDFSVWRDSEIRPGDSWQDAIQTAIDDAIARGFVLLLLSPASLDSEFVASEIDYALSRRGNIIPVVVEAIPPGSMRPSIKYQLEAMQWFNLSTGPFEERIETLIQNLKTREMAP
jgi:hypothetical protein